MAFNDFSMVLTVVVFCNFFLNKLILSYFKYYIIKTQQAWKNIVIKLCRHAAAFRTAWCWGWSHKWWVLRGCRNITASMQISLKSVQTFELSHSHRNTQTHGLCALYKHVHLVGPTESQHSLLFYKSYTQHGSLPTWHENAVQRTHIIHRKRRHIWDFWDR